MQFSWCNNESGCFFRMKAGVGGIKRHKDSEREDFFFVLFLWKFSSEVVLSRIIFRGSPLQWKSLSVQYLRVGACSLRNSESCWESGHHLVGPLFPAGAVQNVAQGLISQRLCVSYEK